MYIYSVLAQNRLTCYLTSRKDELVTGHIRLITEDVWLFHVELLCNPQKPEKMIVYCHSCYSLQELEFYLFLAIIMNLILNTHHQGFI